MALSIFETDNARYFFAMGQHYNGRGTDVIIPHIKSLDALVLETGKDEHNAWNDSITGEHQYFNTLKQVYCEKPTLPIFSVDYPRSERSRTVSSIMTSALIFGGYYLLKNGCHDLTNGENALQYFKGCVELFGGYITCFSQILLVLIAFQKKDLSIISCANALNTCLFPTFMAGFRDAINSKKIEDYLVPRLMRSIKKADKLNIGLLYGAGHSGMRPKLKNKWIRDATNNLYKLLGYYGANKKNLNKVSKFRMLDEELELVKSIDCKLF